MTAFSTLARIFAFFCFICALAPLRGLAYNSDDDRGSGRAVHAVSGSDENHPSARETKHKASTKHAGESRGDLNRIESFGLLTTPKQGGLGIDMWDGSDRDAITGLIEQLPASYTYKTTHDLARRALLTNADVTMLSHKDAKSAETGHDLMTLRIRKLMEMGALDDAASLYKENPSGPYDAPMADAGMLALMYSGQSSLACLEVNAMRDRFAGDHFWLEITGVCDYLLTKMAGGKNAGTEKPGPFASDDSAMIRKIITRGDFRFSGSAQELESLAPLEKAVLVADGRIDYNPSKKPDPAALSPSTLALLAHDSAAPSDFRFQLMMTAARQGISGAQDLANFYKSLSFSALADDSGKLDGIRDIKSWQRLAWLYKSADAARGRINNAVLKTALPLQGEYSLNALLPFASMLADANPEGFSGESIRTGILLGLAANAQISDAWVQQWKKNDSGGKNDFLLQIAYEIGTDSSSGPVPDYQNLLSEIKTLPIQQEQLIKMFIEKLDKHKKLHNIGGTKVYENTVDLTQNVSYVMPSVGLIDSLAIAVNDKHLGEVVLLSSIVLHGVPPDKTFAGLLRGVISGFETVGLTKESRELAKEVILGLGR